MEREGFIQPLTCTNLLQFYFLHHYETLFHVQHFSVERFLLILWILWQFMLTEPNWEAHKAINIYCDLMHLILGHRKQHMLLARTSYMHYSIFLQINKHMMGYSVTCSLHYDRGNLKRYETSNLERKQLRDKTENLFFNAILMLYNLKFVENTWNGIYGVYLYD